jgi:hypothetical protein
VVVAGLTALAVASLFTGCRAVIGVEDLHVADASADAATDAASTEASAEASADGGSSDAQLRSDVDIITAGCVTSDCRKCCKQAFPTQNIRFEEKARNSGCICGGPNTCVTECATTACAASPSPPDMTCAPCLDGHLVGAGCKGARDECKNEPSCAPIAICLEACP